MNTTEGATDTLKGLAILVVLINHYLNFNILGFNAGFANIAIAVFYMLSGYGIYYSLERLSEDGKLTFRDVITFYYMRLARVFPLFWIAYITESVLFDQEISALALLGVHGPNHYWFIASIIQCYILAPIIFVIVRQHRWIAINLMVFLFVALNYTLIFADLHPLLHHYSRFLHLHWRGMYLLYLFIFSMSMLLPQCIDSWEMISESEKKYYFFVLIIIVFLFILLYDAKINLKYAYIKQNIFFIKHVYKVMVITVIPLTIFLMGSIYLISNKIEIRYLSSLGKISFSVYLFHMIFYKGISYGLPFEANSFPELLTFAICFPLFFYACKLTDQAGNHIATALKNIFQLV